MSMAEVETVLPVEAAPSIETARREHEEAEKSLRALRSEDSGLQNAMLEAAAAMDAEKLTRLRRRRDELPALIFVAEATAKQKHLVVLAAERAEMEAELRDAMEELSQAAKIWQEAKDIEVELRGEHGFQAVLVARIEAKLETNREDARDTREELESLIESQSEVY